MGKVISLRAAATRLHSAAGQVRLPGNVFLAQLVGGESLGRIPIALNMRAALTRSSRM